MPDNLFQHQYRIPSARANWHGYDGGEYFVTICTQNREHYFGEIVKNNNDEPEMALTSIGRFAEEQIRNVTCHYSYAEFPLWVVMPNHVHLLLQIHSDPDGHPIAAPTVSQMVNQFKGTVSKKIGFSPWQKGFYDHVIRGETDYREIWKYIEENPLKWSEDQLYNGSM